MKVLKPGMVLLGVAAIFLVVIALGCGGGKTNNADNHDRVSTTVAVTLDEWAVTPDKGEVHTDEVTFVVTSHGAAPHELLVLKTDTPADKLETHSGKVHEDDYTVVGRTSQIMSHETQRLTFRLDNGTYVLLCNIPGHYQAGMYTAFTVSDANHDHDADHPHETEDGHHDDADEPEHNHGNGDEHENEDEDGHEEEHKHREK